MKELCALLNQLFSLFCSRYFPKSCLILQGTPILFQKECCICHVKGCILEWNFIFLREYCISLKEVIFFEEQPKTYFPHILQGIPYFFDSMMTIYYIRKRTPSWNWTWQFNVWGHLAPFSKRRCTFLKDLEGTYSR